MPAINTDVSITNRALQMIGTRSQIASLTEDSNEAIEANKVFLAVRNQVLRAARWNFARARQPLTLHKTRTLTTWDATQPEDPWKYSYEYPDNAIHPRFVNNFSRFAVGVDHEDGLRVVLTDIPDALLTYTVLVEDYDLWDELAIQAHVSGLAGYLAIPLTGSIQIAQETINRANTHLMAAREANANEGLTVHDHIPDWIVARGAEFDNSLTPFINSDGPLFQLVAAA